MHLVKTGGKIVLVFIFFFSLRSHCYYIRVLFAIATLAVNNDDGSNLE